HSHAPSFPTRRSSDLEWAVGGEAHVRGRSDRGQDEGRLVELVQRDNRAAVATDPDAHPNDRTEEADENHLAPDVVLSAVHPEGGDRKSTRLNSSHLVI